MPTSGRCLHVNWEVFRSNVRQSTYFQGSCQIPEFVSVKALSLFWVVGHTNWGSDKVVLLLRLHRELVQYRLDFGSIVHGSASGLVLIILDAVYHAGLRI